MSIASEHFELRPFRKFQASLVCDWVHDDNELFWLAPQTLPPLTAEKVVGWTARRGRPMFFWTSAWDEPVGYAELNDYPGRSYEYWIGHFLIDPQHRGLGLGRRMLRLLLDQAFGPMRAYRVALIVFPENRPAVRCYESANMRSAGWQEKSFPSRAGTYRMLEMAIDRKGYKAFVEREEASLRSRRGE